MSKYKSQKELEQFKNDELFKVSRGDIAEFYYVPLQGLELLSMVSIKHLLLVIKHLVDFFYRIDRCQRISITTCYTLPTQRRQVIIC